MTSSAEQGYAEQGYRGPQVCKIVGITYRQLDYWARTNLVRPSVMDANGSGTQRLYSFRDLLELKLIKQMLDAGLALQSARKAVESLRKFGGETTAVRIVIEGPKVVIAETEEQWLDLMRDGQGVFSFNVAPVAATIQQQLFEMPHAAGQ
jgi:DNA-binding transcriptional MerR regulator